MNKLIFLAAIVFCLTISCSNPKQPDNSNNAINQSANDSSATINNRNMITQKITPYLWVEKDAKAVADYYLSTFKDGKLKDFRKFDSDESGNDVGIETAVIEIAGMEFSILAAGPLFKFNEAAAVDAARADYGSAVVDANVLGKATRKARELALRHLATLYALDSTNPIFRALRRLWALNEAAQPLMALSVALARDPLLRGSQNFILSLPAGTPLTRDAVEAHLSASDPDRFIAASLKSFAQNVAGTWTASGHLQGKVRKTRAVAEAHPESIALLLFLGYLEGRTGQRLFTSDWMNLLGRSPDELEALANSASHRGLLVFMNAGGVKEVRFPGYLTPEEERRWMVTCHP